MRQYEYTAKWERDGQIYTHHDAHSTNIEGAIMIEAEIKVQLSLHYPDAAGVAAKDIAVRLAPPDGLKLKVIGPDGI